MGKSGGLGSGPIAEGIVADMEDLAGEKSETCRDGRESPWIGFGKAHLAGDEDGLERGEQVQIGEDTAESGVEVREDDATMCFGYTIDRFACPGHGEPGAGGLEMKVEGLEKRSEGGLVGEGGSCFAKDLPDEALPPGFLVRIVRACLVRERGRGAFPDDTEGAIQHGGIDGNAESVGYPAVGSAHILC